MKHALVNGQLTPATSDAPSMATCPSCGGQVKLRNRQGTYFWWHVQMPPGGCPPPSPELVVLSGSDHSSAREQELTTIREGFEDLKGMVKEGLEESRIDRQMCLDTIEALTERFDALEHSLTPPEISRWKAVLNWLKKRIWILAGGTVAALSEPLIEDELYPEFREQLQLLKDCWDQVSGRFIEHELVRVPAGYFGMGTNRLALKRARVGWETWFEGETPYHHVYLPDYAIGKYPVTNAEFDRFIEGGGYRNPDCWTQAGWKRKESEGWTQPRNWRERKYNQPNQPVVGISWYEAVAYCNWLAARTGKRYCLPSEAEWEKAARGTDGRLWPWGNDPPDESRCHFGWKVGKTAPVSQCSPRGDSPHGCAGMAGNVWEWTRSLYRSYPYDSSDDREDLEATGSRVLRGGSFYCGSGYVRCAVRYEGYPYGRLRDYGFRVVVAPSSDSGL